MVMVVKSPGPVSVPTPPPIIVEAGYEKYVLYIMLQIQMLVGNYFGMHYALTVIFHLMSSNKSRIIVVSSSTFGLEGALYPRLLLAGRHCLNPVGNSILK